MYEEQPREPTLFGQNLFGLFVAVIAFFVFLVGRVYAQMGVVVLAAVANQRAKCRADHDDYFSTARALEQRVSGLIDADKEGADKEASGDRGQR